MNIKKILYRIKQICRGEKGIYCQKGLRNNIQNGVFLHEMTSIGNSNYIGQGTKIINATIGNYCSIADDVKIGMMEHDLECVSTNWRIFEPSQGVSKFSGWTKPTIIENDVWLGANVIVKQGVTIHNGAVVGAGAVVVKDVPSYAIVVGVPAKIIRYRFDNQTISKISKTEWWNYPEEDARLICKKLQKDIKQ